MTAEQVKASHKILSIAHWYPNHKNQHAGIFIKNHAAAAQAIAEVTVIDFSIAHSSSLYSKSVSREVDENGVDTIHIKVRSRFYKVLYYALFYQKAMLRRTLKQMKIEVASYSIIQSNVLFPSGIIGLYLAKKFHKPLVHVEHWSSLRDFLTNDIHRKKGRRVLDYACKVAVVSERLMEQMQNYCDPAKIEIIPNVVSSHFGYLPKTKIPGVIHFLSVANWKKPKNPFVLIEALAALQIKHQDLKFELTLVGEGIQLEKIRSLNNGVQIHFAGVVPNESLSAYYQNADFYLLGSDYETFSIVAIEALMTGTPVIGSSVGVLPEIIDDRNGVLCANDLSSWEEGIQRALDTQYNHESIAANIKDRYTKERIAHLFEAMYNEVRILTSKQENP